MARHRSLLAGLALALGACGCSEGEGTISFTTWGEAFIEQEIPVDPGDGSGFVDGWTLRYEKFLVNFQNILVADLSRAIAVEFPGSKLFDNHARGVKPIVEFSGVPAGAWERVSYEIAPVSSSTEPSPEVDSADLALMQAGGFSLYVAGAARKGELEKHFAWGFTLGTSYHECHTELDGRDEEGLVVKNHGALEAQLTTHGDHLYYDRLQASANPAAATSLRFDGIAAADTNADGEITLEELDARLLDVTLYNPSGFDAATMGDFVRSLSRTIGHFRGEGECTVSKL